MKRVVVIARRLRPQRLMRKRSIAMEPRGNPARLFCALALVGTVVLSSGLTGPSVGRAQGRSTDREQARQQSLGALRLELAELRVEFERVSAQSDDVVGRVGRLRKALEVQQLRVREAQAALAEALDGVGVAERQLATLDGEHVVLLERLRQRSRRLYQLGRWGNLRMFFSLSRNAVADRASAVVGAAQADIDVRSVGDRPDPLAGLRLLRAVVRQDADAMAELEANRKQAAMAREELERRKQAARSWLDQQRQVSARLAARRREETAALAALAQRRSDIELRLSGVKSRHDRMNRLLEILAAEGQGGLGGLPIEDFKGALDWPIQGRLGRRFGPYRDAQYGTLVPHNGIAIGTQVGTAVRAVYPGRVVYSGQFRDVGLVVVLQHSRDALTMYSGLADAVVGEGDILTLGDRVGVAGREVYFELRVGRVPEDPLGWLSGGG